MNLFKSVQYIQLSHMNQTKLIITIRTFFVREYSHIDINIIFISYFAQ